LRGGRRGPVHKVEADQQRVVHHFHRCQELLHSSRRSFARTHARTHARTRTHTHTTQGEANLSVSTQLREDLFAHLRVQLQLHCFSPTSTRTHERERERERENEFRCLSLEVRVLAERGGVDIVGLHVPVDPRALCRA
jgi:hypothetical protein